MADDEYDEFVEYDPIDDPIDDHAEAIGPEGQDGLSASSHQVTSSVRIVYCTSCGCQLDGLHIGEPCPNCRVPVGSAAQNGVKTNGSAIAALVLGICSFVGCFFYAVPGIVCAVLAIFFAGKVRRGVASGEIHASSLSTANAGRVCGIVSLCLSILALLAIIAWFIVMFAFIAPQQQQMQQQMNQQMQQQSQPTYPPPAQPTPATEPETQTTNP